MPYADTLLTCAQCGTTFIFTVDEQRRLAESGQPVEPPTLCPVCRTDQRLKERPPVTEDLLPKETPSAPEPGTGRLRGKVKWFNRRKGFGFIIAEDGREIFVHYTGIATEGPKRLKDGQPVEFEIEQTPKGPQAVRVVPMG